MSITSKKKSPCKRITGFQVTAICLDESLDEICSLLNLLIFYSDDVFLLPLSGCSFYHKIQAKYWLLLLIHKSELLMV